MGKNQGKNQAKNQNRDSIDDIEIYYRNNQEDNRHRIQMLEFAVTDRLLKKYLSQSSHILEIGAGTGRYTLDLARRANLVTALELVPELTALNQKKIAAAGLTDKVQFHSGDARGCIETLPAEAFDAALVMGPLYHLVSQKDRTELMASTVRTLKPGGLMITTHLSRVGLMGYMLTRFPDWGQTSNPEIRQILDNGHLPDHPRNGEFRGYFATLKEIQELHEKQNLKILRIHSQDPCIGSFDEIYNRLPEDLQTSWADILTSLSHEPLALGSGRSLFCVSQKTGD